MWISLIFSMLLFIPLIFLFGFKELKRKYIFYVTSKWASMILYSTGSHIFVSGIENIPSDRNFVIVSNHQGNMDIPLFMKTFSHTVSFIAKKELMLAPFVNLWILAMQCPFIDRKKVFGSKKVIEKRLAAKDKNPILIFPEGTRSKSTKMGKFKSGGLNLIYQSDRNVLPVAVIGTYQIWEQNKKINPAKIYIKILPIIPHSEMHKMEFKEFLVLLEDMIKREVSEYAMR
jgi:1-acyl-sn-glycerol-3-phosphate acyltransferase